MANVSRFSMCNLHCTCVAGHQTVAWVLWLALLSDCSFIEPVSPNSCTRVTTIALASCQHMIGWCDIHYKYIPTIISQPISEVYSIAGNIRRGKLPPFFKLCPNCEKLTRGLFILHQSHGTIHVHVHMYMQPVANGLSHPNGLHKAQTRDLVRPV